MPSKKEMFWTVLLVVIAMELFFAAVKPYADKYIGTLKVA
jgi:hypothetical protein